MYLRFTKARQKTYLVVVEGYRHEGKVKQRTICNLGPVDDQNKQNILAIGSKLLKACGGAALIDGNELEEETRVNWGIHEVLKAIWCCYSLDKIFTQLLSGRKLIYDLQGAIKLMLASRLCNPCSKLALYENQESYSGFPLLKLQDLYKSLDELSYYQEELNQHLFKTEEAINGKTHITFFDVTTLYFESQKADSLRSFGFSKDCKFNEVQVVLSLLVNEQAMPIACEIFQGNMYEGKTLVTTISRLKEKYKLEKIVIVADRGLYNNTNLQLIADAGFEYIVGTRLRNSKKLIKDEVFKENYKHISDPKGNYKFKYKLVTNKSDNHTERIVIVWSEKRALKDRKDRERLIQKAYNLVENNKVTDKRGAKKYITIKCKQAKINEAKIELDRAWDGYYGISSNSCLTENEIIKAYHDLWQIEDSFRAMKSHFEIRPVFHWTEKRIKGHIMLNFIVLIFERYLEKLVKSDIGLKESISPAKIRKAINKMQRSTIKVDKARFYNYGPICDLGKSILHKLSIPIPRPEKIS